MFGHCLLLERVATQNFRDSSAIVSHPDPDGNSKMAAVSQFALPLKGDTKADRVGSGPVAVADTRLLARRIWHDTN